MAMNRRTFLKAAGVAACVVVGGGLVGGGIMVANMLNQDEVEAAKAGFAKMLVKRYGNSQGQALTEKIFQEYQAIYAQLPDLGSKEENRWAGNMPLAALSLAAYRVLTPTYAALEEVGQLIYETVESGFAGAPAWVMRMMYSEKREKEELTQLAARSQLRKYPEDWVLTYIAGNGQNFTLGVDVTECAILKFYQAQGAPELARYLCLTDYLTSEAMGRGLVRQTTLAEGCNKCDFRYKQGRPSYVHPLRDGWPPKFTDC